MNNSLMLKDRYLFGWIIFAILIVIILYVSLILAQNSTEQNLQISMLKQQIRQQEAQTENLSLHVESDLKLIILNLESASLLPDLKMANFSSDVLSEQLFMTFNSLTYLTEISSLTILDENGFVVNDIDESNEGSSVGLDLSFREYAIQTKDTKLPHFSNGFPAFLTKEQAIVITFPIINDVGDYKGLSMAFLPTIPFFNHYGEITHIDTQSIIISDRENKIIFHPDKSLIGQNISLIKNNENDISQINIQDINLGMKEILTTYPITFNKNIVYYVHVLTPTDTIIFQANDILFTQKITLAILVASISIILGMLIVFVKKYYLAQKSRYSVIGEMGASMAHDIRNPLHVIKNNLDVLKHKRSFDEDGVNRFKIIDSAIYRIDHQINDVLDFLKEVPLEKTVHKFSTVLENSIQDIILPENIKISKPEKDLSIYCNARSFEAVLANIILNAIQAIGSSTGEIKISLTDSEKATNIKIQDSGPGIKPENLSHIFEPLYTTKQEGTGLGLATCKKIIEKHNGSVGVSINPTTFTIMLPKNNL